MHLGDRMYQPFRQHLEESLFEHFELQPRAIPQDLEQRVSERGRHPATIQSWCYQCPQLRKIRYLSLIHI